MIEARDGATIIRKEYSLSGLTLVSEQFSFITAPDMTAQNCQYNNTDSVAITQSNITLEDNVTDWGTNFVGNISGQVYSYDNGTTRYALGLKVNDDIVNENCGYDYTFYDANGEIIGIGMIQNGNFPQNGYVAVEFYDSANQRVIDPTDVKSLEIGYSDYSGDDTLMIDVVYATNFTKGS